MTKKSSGIEKKNFWKISALGNCLSVATLFAQPFSPRSTVGPFQQLPYSVAVC